MTVGGPGTVPGGGTVGAGPGGPAAGGAGGGFAGPGPAGADGGTVGGTVGFGGVVGFGGTVAPEEGAEAPAGGTAEDEPEGTEPGFLR